MFSMKYTSPKVTPKKGAPPTPSDPLPSSYPLLPSSSSVCGAAGAADRYANIYKNSTEKGVNSANGFTGEDSTVRSHPNHSKIRGAVTTKRSTTLTKANLSNSHGYYANTISENDSAVADTLKEMEPRPNFLALLEREYTNGSGSGEGSNRKMLHIDENTTSGDGVEPAVANDCIKEENNAIVDGERIEESVDCDQKNGTDEMKNLQSIQSSSINIPEAYSLHETTEGSFEYRRSDSMEPFGVHSEFASPSTRTTFVDEQSVDVTPIVGQTSSFQSSPGSGEEETNDARSVPPNLDEERSKCSNSSPIIYDMSAQPASPMMSEINADRFGGEPIHKDSPSRFSAAGTESDIGGDTYFDGPALCLDEKKQRADSIDDDLVHVPLPPRVNRTTINRRANDSAPFLPNCPSTPSQPAALFPKQRSLPMSPRQIPMSPRRPCSHTHSLLDDCSDDEDEITSFTIVDSPTRHTSSYSCLPRPRANSYFKKQKQRQGKNRHNSRSHSAGTSATQVASNNTCSNNIQQALLQTRHRRWDCQSAYAGAHAQSNQVFDLSNRGHSIVGYLPENGDGALAVRMSVSVEAIRAAALASGLWRTVRLVRLPKGLFWSHAEMYECLEDNEVWALLKMLNSTFPILDQIDFGGDISRATVSKDVANWDDWRNEILSCIMQCLPNIVAIDGFVVEQNVFGAESRGEKASTSKEEATGRQNDASNMRNSSPYIRQETNDVENSAACVDCDSVPMCGLSDLVDSEAQSSRLNAPTGATRGDGDLRDITLSNNRVPTSHHAEEITSVTGPGQCDFLADISSGAFEDASANTMMPTEETLAIEDYPSHESSEDDMQKIPTLSSSSSMLSSSRSWGSNSSGNTRPPPCPTSASRERPRLPTKPADQKKAKGSFMKAGAGLKRRVLGLIPSVSMMDEDEEEDSDDSEEGVENDCPTDLL
eukprot:CAMPEP_0201922032 /NCGR_PEP_ID=MMETSP0903-20130614/10196_1 /ASSEMBLY_ACC=CAM_ASM_000552 /TAXON_ID=420261 /ORGANISM="Thalassiosira antarctica, Strain CCMP982" /LENGTH=937 /DNA_ID=CAMNT_0048459105 /DNA_START=151 /DNA_END=2964 /DNA_ORIENTATION=-